jgi:hypothetical protein
VRGLAAIVTLPDPDLWGMGGIVRGLAAIVTLPDEPVLCGMGGMVSGLAIATVVATVKAATKTAARTLMHLVFIILHPLLERQLRIQRVTRKWENRHPKSNIARKYFCELGFLLILQRFGAYFRHIFALQIHYSPSVCPLPGCVSGRS